MMRRQFLSFLAFLGIAKKANAEDEAAARKMRSENILRQEHIPINEYLPVIENAATSIRRNKQEVVERTVALMIVAVKGETGDAETGDIITRQFQADTFFSPYEKAFMQDKTPSQHDRTQFTWRYEAVEVLLWALAIYDELKAPLMLADVSRLAATMRELGTQGLQKQGRLRPQSEILDAADLIYRYHWAIVDARVNNRRPSFDLEPGVIYERHYVLNWLIGYSGQSWDDISTDT